MSAPVEESTELDLWGEIAPEKHAFLGVEAGGEFYGFPLASVREIMMKPTVSEVPRSPDPVLGVISVRGDITTVVELRRLLRLAGDTTGSPERVLLVDNGEELIGVGVDAVIQVFRLAPSEIEFSSHMTADLSEYVVGVARISQQAAHARDNDDTQVASASEGKVPAPDAEEILILLDPMTLLANP